MTWSKFSAVSVFSNMLYDENQEPGNAGSGNQQKVLQIKKLPLLTVIITS